MVNFLGDLLHASRKAQQADVLRHKLEGVEAWMQARRGLRVQSQLLRVPPPLPRPRAGGNGGRLSRTGMGAAALQGKVGEMGRGGYA